MRFMDSVRQYRALKILEREADDARRVWQRSSAEYHHTAEVFKDQAGAWWSTGPIGLAQDRASELLDEYWQKLRRYELARMAYER